jgi:hypothetical protein
MIMIWIGYWRVEVMKNNTPPSFLVRNNDNVNAQLYRARGLIIMWDFLEYKGRIGRTHVIMSCRDEPSTLKVMPVKCRSRYFDDGRLHMSRKIRGRLGKFEKVPGLMMTLTYDPKKIGKLEAWASFGRDTRRFLNSVNQYRKRRGWHRLHYFWVVENQKETGYPHVHIFFPNLRWLAPLDIINGNWRQGRSNIESPKKIRVSCAAYISKYLRKMRGWSDLHLALLWSGRCRMYGFSRGFSAKLESKESEWQRRHVVETSDLEALERSLEERGFVVEHSEKSEPCQISQGRAPARSQTSTLTNSNRTMSGQEALAPRIEDER